MGLSLAVLGTIQRHALLRRGARVVVALSGGSDSVALLRLLRELEQAGELTVAGVAHLNHGLRPEADEDERFCRAMADALGVPYRTEVADVRSRAERERTSIEDSGRRARYEFFERVADELGADAIATGHTKDDQAETFLLRLLRGAGPRGLAGIHARAGRIVRPLLDLSREDLRTYLTSIGQPFREDASNADVSIPRNRVRHELLPLLRERFSPAITDVLAREASIARQDEDRLQLEAIDLARSIVLRGETSETVEVDRSALVALHPAIAVRVARLALQELAPDRFVGFDHIERLLEFARQPDEQGAMSLPGQHAVRRGATLVLRKAPFAPFSNSLQVSLSIPGEVTFGDWAISATPCPKVDQTTLGGWHLSRKGASHRRWQAVVDGAKVGAGLAVRARRPGDRFQPLGMGGREKKLQDLLVDRKITRDRRDSLPLVVDEIDRIVWVVGEAVSEDFRVTEPSRAVIFLKARRLGGQG
jgi:tRNA(Ile)-lysidine synthase